MEGWNSWNNVHHNINETVVRQTADAFVATGLAAAGYQYGMYISFYFTHKNNYHLIIVYSEYG